MKISLLRCTAV